MNFAFHRANKIRRSSFASISRISEQKSKGHGPVSKLSLLVLILLAYAFPISADVVVIANMGESRVVLADGDTYKTIIELETGKNPHEVRVSPDQRHAYIAAGKSITAVDLKQRKVRATFDLGTHAAHDIRVSRDGRRIWAACAPTQSILELDSSTGKIMKTYATKQEGSWFLEITPDERKIYAPNLEGKSVSVIDLGTGNVKVIPFENAVYGIDITPDGKQVWVSGRDLTVIDTSRDEVIARIKTSEPETGRLRLTSNGEKLVVALSKKLAVYDVKKRNLIAETDLPASPKVLTISSDNKRALLTNPQANSVSVVDIVNGKLLTSFQTGTRPDGIAFAK